MDRVDLEHQGWRVPRDAVMKAQDLISKGRREEGLQVARMGFAQFPNAPRLSLIIAEMEDELEPDFHRRFEAWSTCVRLHGARSKPRWMRKLVQMIKAEFGFARFAARHEDHRIAVQTIEELFDLVWPVPAHESWDPTAPDAERTRRLMGHQIDLLRYLIGFHRSRFEFDAASQFERRLFGYPHEFISHADFVDAISMSAKYFEVRDQIAETELREWASARFPVSLISMPDGDPKEAGLRDEAESFYLKLADVLALRGQVEEANAVLDLFPHASTKAAEIAGIRAKMDGAGFRAMLNDVVSPAGLEITEADILVARHANPTGDLVVIFAPSPQAFNLFSASLHNLLKSAGCDMVFVHDNLERHFLKGLEWSRPSELETILTQLMRDLRSVRLFTIGWSAGGGAALRLGKTMGAEAVLAFSPVIVDRDAKFAASRLAFAEAARVDPDYNVNIPELFAKGPNPAARIFVGAGARGDLEFAEKIRGMDGVTIELLDDLNDHASLRWLLGQKRMPAILSGMLGR